MGSVVEALWDYNRKSDKQLTLKQGEVIFVVNRLNPSWWLIQNKFGEYGYVPANYLIVLMSVEDLSSENVPQPLRDLYPVVYNINNKPLQKYRLFLWQNCLEKIKKTTNSSDMTVFNDLKKQLEITTELPPPPPIPLDEPISLICPPLPMMPFENNFNKNCPTSPKKDAIHPKKSKSKLPKFKPKEKKMRIIQ